MVDKLNRSLKFQPSHPTNFQNTHDNYQDLDQLYLMRYFDQTRSMAQTHESKQLITNFPIQIDKPALKNIQVL